MACCDWSLVTGALTAQCVGVSKTAVCKLIKRDDVTFTLSIRPLETGRHILSIKFNNDHVPGYTQALYIAQKVIIIEDKNNRY